MTTLQKQILNLVLLLGLAAVLFFGGYMISTAAHVDVYAYVILSILGVVAVIKALHNVPLPLTRNKAAWAIIGIAFAVVFAFAAQAAYTVTIGSGGYFLPAIITLLLCLGIWKCKYQFFLEMEEAKGL